MKKAPGFIEFPVPPAVALARSGQMIPRALYGRLPDVPHPCNASVGFLTLRNSNDTSQVLLERFPTFLNGDFIMQAHFHSRAEHQSPTFFKLLWKTLSHVSTSFCGQLTFRGENNSSYKHQWCICTHKQKGFDDECFDFGSAVDQLAWLTTVNWRHQNWNTPKTHDFRALSRKET